MTLLNDRTPTGAERISAVIFDWAGTTVDHGSLAPIKTIERVFSEAGVPVSGSEARRDMGIAKREHIRALLNMPRVQQAWKEQQGRLPDEAIGDELYARFIPLQFVYLEQYSKVIRGVPEVVKTLRAEGMKIGSTTGYTRPMLDLLVRVAANEGYQPDCSFCPEDVGAGRPHPYMIFAAAIQLKTYPLAAIVKVGDTESDIAEGLNAGVWSIGVAATGNCVGLDEPEFLALSTDEREALMESGRRSLGEAGAHFVIDRLNDLPAVISQINQLLQRDSRA